MAQVYKRNLKVMMIKIIFIITLLISYYAEATSSTDESPNDFGKNH